jgi:hypothetical protein
MRPSAPPIVTMRVNLEGGGSGCGTGNVALILIGNRVELWRLQNHPKSLSMFQGGNGLIGLGFIWVAAMWSRPLLDLFFIFYSCTTGTRGPVGTVGRDFVWLTPIHSLGWLVQGLNQEHGTLCLHPGII